MKKIVFTGGGTAGHVIPNLELINSLDKNDWQFFYIGSTHGVEKDLVEKEEINFQGIACGKLRRYFSWQNFLDPFKVLLGIIQSLYKLKKIKPNLIFSKGGFVAFPVVFAAWVLRIPVVAHESDFSPGLANKLSFPFVNKICLTFDEAKNFFKNQKKVIVTGNPIRENLFTGSLTSGNQICGFIKDVPCIMIMGGSAGSKKINEVVRENLSNLLKKVNIIHICGLGNIDSSLNSVAGYMQFDYVDEDLKHLFARADIIVSRSGANSVYEILALKKPHIFIPLSLAASRGDQIFNANFFAKKGLSTVIVEEELSAINLYEIVLITLDNYASIVEKISDYNISSGTDKIISVIRQESL